MSVENVLLLSDGGQEIGEGIRYTSYLSDVDWLFMRAQGIRATT